jgi:guanylate kinase
MSKPGDIKRRGIMLVLSSPSGAGKTTLTRALLEHENREEPGKLELSISVTTRPRRGSEAEGVHYHFVARRHFEAMRDGGELLEWAEVHGNFYGTPRESVERALAEGRDVLFDIDWQGARQLKEKMPEDVISVFVLPPSALELKSRLERRAEDSADVIDRRLRNAYEEIQHWDEYNYPLVNRDFNKSLARLQAILTAERLKRVQKPDLENFVAQLLSDLRAITP